MHTLRSSRGTGPSVEKSCEGTGLLKYLEVLHVTSAYNLGFLEFSLGFGLRGNIVICFRDFVQLRAKL